MPIAEYRPGLTCGMRCERAEKSAWSRANEDPVPEPNFDKDAFADGMGGWDTQSAREPADADVAAVSTSHSANGATSEERSGRSKE